MLDQLLSPDILIPLGFFAMPVGLYWLKRHYNALEKGHVTPGGQLPSNDRMRLLEAQNKELLERVQNLESIVVALDEGPKQKALKAKSDP